jgi:UDP-glucose 4-epimerase
MVVRPSSFYEYSFYAREGIASLYAELYGMRSVGLRYFSVYGPGEEHKGGFANNISQFIWEMMKGKSPVIYGDGTQTRDFIFVDDVVEANILSMGPDLKGEVVNAGTGVSTSFNELARMLNEALGTSIKPV